VILDVWWGHISDEFRGHLLKYDWIVLLYVPASMTCVLQPCDVGVNKEFKGTAVDMFCDDVIERVEAAGDKAAAEGRDVAAAEDEALKQLLSIPHLRNLIPKYVTAGVQAAYRCGMRDGVNAIARSWDKAWWGKVWNDDAAGVALRADARKHVARLFKDATQRDVPGSDEESDVYDDDNSWETVHERVYPRFLARQQARDEARAAMAGFLNTAPAPKNKRGRAAAAAAAEGGGAAGATAAAPAVTAGGKRGRGRGRGGGGCSGDGGRLGGGRGRGRGQDKAAAAATAGEEAATLRGRPTVVLGDEHDGDVDARIAAEARAFNEEEDTEIEEEEEEEEGEQTEETEEETIDFDESEEAEEDRAAAASEAEAAAAAGQRQRRSAYLVCKQKMHKIASRAGKSRGRYFLVKEAKKKRGG
jgi:uncharacterized membrane protein YgcG